MKFIKKAVCVLTAYTMFVTPVLAFTDVESGAWYSNTVENMSEKGYLSGYNDGSFRPNNTISKAEFTSIVARLAGLTSVTGGSGHWASGTMQAALDASWYDWDEIPPSGESFDEPIERQLAVKILMNALFKGQEGDYNTASKAISDFSSINGRYYNPVVAAYSLNIVSGDDKARFNPTSSLTRAEACTIIERAMNKAGITKTIEPVQPKVTVSSNSKGVSVNGQLKVVGTQLCNQNGDPVVLRGMSTHGLQWFPEYTSSAFIKALGDKGSNVMRFAMYTGENGYISNPAVKTTLVNGVDNAIANDMYAIIDWHILSDGNPMQYADRAADFFTEMANKYKDSPAVIYEICNEPNGGITWENDVKPYASRMIDTIRAIDSDAIILVGCPDWDQRLEDVISSPLDGTNIMYTCHFYAGTHTQWLRDKVASAINAGRPIFISEWGTSSADGSGGVYLEEAQRWIDFMSSNNISWCNWSLCNKQESSAALTGTVDATDGISDGELSESGKFVFGKF